MFFYEEVFRALNKAKVDYVVFGGVAAILYGVQRTTMDLDIMTNMLPQNIDKLFSALKKLGYKTRLPISVEEFKNEKNRKLWTKKKNMKVFTFFHTKDDLKMIDIFI